MCQYKVAPYKLCEVQATRQLLCAKVLMHAFFPSV